MITWVSKLREAERERDEARIEIEVARQAGLRAIKAERAATERVYAELLAERENADGWQAIAGKLANRAGFYGRLLDMRRKAIADLRASTITRGPRGRFQRADAAQ